MRYTFVFTKDFQATANTTAAEEEYEDDFF